MLKFKKNKTLVIAFLLPALLFYIIFMIIPVVETFVVSFFRWEGVSGFNTSFVGLSNYIHVFRNADFWGSMGKLAYFVAISMIAQLGLGFVLAYLISLGLKGKRFFRLVFFFPIVLSATAISLMWSMILSTNYGMLNTFLKSIGLGSLAKSWLTDPHLCFTVITLINSWLTVGISFVIIYAGIIAIPGEIYEAASIDGAKGFSRIFYIIIPMIREIIAVCAIMVLANSMKVFDIFFVITSATFGPGDANLVPMGLMYKTAFQGYNFGRGSVIALTVMVLGGVLSGITYFKGFGRKEEVVNEF